MEIESLQRVVAHAILGTVDVGEAAAHVQGRDPASSLHHYRRQLLSRWHRTLGIAFPVVEQLVGHDAFAGLTREYGTRHPSVATDLHGFGSRFPSFVRAFVREPSVAYLADVAQLEWYVRSAHDAPDAHLLRVASISPSMPEQLLSSTLVLHPACRWMASRHSIVSIWQAHHGGDLASVPAGADRAEQALVSRVDFRVRVDHVGAAEVKMLEVLSQRQPVRQALDAACHIDPEFDLARTLVDWLKRGVVLGIGAVSA